MQNYFGLTGGIGLKADSIRGLNFSPMLNFSSVVGNSLFRFGSALVFDMTSQEFDKFNAGLSYNTELLITSLTL